MDAQEIQGMAKGIVEAVLQRKQWVPNAQVLGGPGGIWNDPALMTPVISLVPLPEGLLSHLPSFMTDIDVEKYAYITGYTAPPDRDDTSGLTACGPCQTVGEEKNCFQKVPWGYKCLDSRTMKLLDYGHRYSRGDPMDLYVINEPTIARNLGAPAPAERGRGNLLDPIRQQFLMMGREFIHWFNRIILWYGNPARNVLAPDGEPLYAEPYGLTTLINTNHVDERDGQTICENLDSEIVNWGNLNIIQNADLFLRTITSRLRRIWKRARQTNMLFDPRTDGVLVMREEMFYGITRIWSCTYATTNCATLAAPAVQQAQVDALQLARPEDPLNADNMFNNQYLMVAGVRVPVVMEDALNEVDNGDGTFTSSIYYVPLRIRGNVPATFAQFFDYTHTTPTRAILALSQELGLAGPGIPAHGASDGGRFLWMKDAQRACAVLIAMTMPRIVLRVPQLAMAINNVRVAVDAHFDSAFDDQAYWRGCGVYEVDMPTNYGPFGDVLMHFPGGGTQVLGQGGGR